MFETKPAKQHLCLRQDTDCKSFVNLSELIHKSSWIVFFVANERLKLVTKFGAKNYCYEHNHVKFAYFLQVCNLVKQKLFFEENMAINKILEIEQ